MIPSHIKVFELNNQYLLKIPAGQKLRASRIVGRRWDPNLVAWVYPRTIASYEALKEEFQKDADSFDIRKPKNVPLPKPAKPIDPDDDVILEDDWKELTEKTANIHQEFSSLTGKVNTLLSNFKVLEESSSAIEKLIKEDSKQRKKESSPTKEIETTSLDLNSGSHLALIEKALIHLAFANTGQDQSFAVFISGLNPLTRPEKFITRSHERLLHELAEMLGDPEPTESRFASYIHRVKDANLVSIERSNNVPAILFSLNTHRNNIIHAKDMSESELLNRSITYLMNMAMIWTSVASKPVDE